MQVTFPILTNESYQKYQDNATWMMIVQSLPSSSSRMSIQVDDFFVLLVAN